MATAMVRHLQGLGMRVLAIDADHNMDLTYSLGIEPSVYIGRDPDAIKEHVGALREGTYADALRTGTEAGILFSIFPADSYTAQISVEVDSGLRIMTAGPHTQRVRSQEACSHSLAAPLKVYLPLLKLKSNEAVIVDERAGTDPVATGILAGVDLAVIVREPTVNSRRVAEQIRHELELAGIKHILVENKELGLEADTAKAARDIEAAI